MWRALTALSFAACIGAPATAHAQAAGDPWEGVNRDVFATHEAIDKAVLEPVARGYHAITPAPLRDGVLNFLRNLRAPVIFANDLLQGEISRAGTTAVRFGVNTTIGIAGVFDPASGMGLERHDEDFGQTLAVWGFDPGPYIFVPLLGPTTLRDGAGRIVDVAFDPLTWAEFDDVNTARASRTAVAGIASREQVLDAVDGLREGALDPYASIRTSYGLLRASAIQNGRAEAQQLPDFGTIPNEPVMETPAQSLDPPTTTGELAPGSAKGDNR
jgi:phospholipid-binding lipoprotein MlaA